MLLYIMYAQQIVYERDIQYLVLLYKLYTLYLIRVVKTETRVRGQCVRPTIFGHLYHIINFFR